MNFTLLAIGLSGGFAHSIYAATSKGLLKNRLSEPFLLLLYISVFQALLTPLLWLGVSPVLPPVEGLIPLLMCGITGAAGYLLLYMALHSGDVSSVMPIMGSKVILSALLAIPMLKESHSLPVYVATILVAISIAMLSYTPSKSANREFSMKPVMLMLGCCMVFAVTDIYIKRTLVFLDSYNFTIYYNAMIGVLALSIIPYLRQKKVSLSVGRADLRTCVISAGALVAATLLFVLLLELSEGVVIPNILLSSRGVFIVLISAILTYRGSVALDTQSRGVYALRLIASVLIMISIAITLSN